MSIFDLRDNCFKNEKSKKIYLELDETADALRVLKRSVPDEAKSLKLKISETIDNIDWFLNRYKFLTKDFEALELALQTISQTTNVPVSDNEKKRAYAIKWMQFRRPFVHNAKDAGKSQEEIKAMLSILEKQFRMDNCFEGLNCIKSDFDADLHHYAMSWYKKRKEIIDEARKQNKSKEELREILSAEERKYRQSFILF